MGAIFYQCDEAQLGKTAFPPRGARPAKGRFVLYRIGQIQGTPVQAYQSPLPISGASGLRLRDGDHEVFVKPTQGLSSQSGSRLRDARPTGAPDALHRQT